MVKHTQTVDASIAFLVRLHQQIVDVTEHELALAGPDGQM